VAKVTLNPTYLVDLKKTFDRWWWKHVAYFCW